MAYMKCPKCNTVGLMRDRQYTRKYDGAEVVAQVCHRRRCGYSRVVSEKYPETVRVDMKKQQLFADIMDDSKSRKNKTVSW